MSQSEVHQYAVQVVGRGWVHYDEIYLTVNSNEPTIFEDWDDAYKLARRAELRYSELSVEDVEVIVHKRLVTTTVGPWSVD